MMLPEFSIGTQLQEEEGSEGALMLSDRALSRHLLLTGTTGMGKSTLLRHLLRGSFTTTDACIMSFDSHGTLAVDAALELLSKYPERSRDIHLLDFSNEQRPIVFNPLDVSSFNQVEMAVYGIREFFESQIGLDDQIPPKASGFIMQVASALIEANLHLQGPYRCNLTQIETFLVDEDFRSAIMSVCSNPSVIAMFDCATGPYNMMSVTRQNEFIYPVLKVLSSLFGSLHAQHTFAPLPSSIKMQDSIQAKQALLFKLTRAAHQRPLAQALAHLLLSQLITSVHIWGKEQDYESASGWRGSAARVFIDEAASIIPDHHMLSHLADSAVIGRDLALILATQYPQQFPPLVQKDVLGNIASRIAFQLDPNLAESAAAGFHPHDIDADQIGALPKYEAYLRAAEPNGKSQASRFAAAPSPPITDQARGLYMDISERCSAFYGKDPQMLAQSLGGVRTQIIKELAERSRPESTL